VDFPRAGAEGASGAIVCTVTVATVARFAVIDQNGKLAGFGVKLSGDDAGAAFALPQHQCLPR